MSSEEAAHEISDIESTLTLLPDVPGIYDIWKQIVMQHRVLGVQVHDARLVAVMRVYELESILTFDVSDFARFGDIAVHPSSVA